MIITALKRGQGQPISVWVAETGMVKGREFSFREVGCQHGRLGSCNFVMEMLI
jgi:hypothetical protein